MNFICAIMDWLRRVGVHCTFEFSEGFAYDMDRNVLVIGVNEMPNVKAFEQMLYEYGMKYIDIYAPVLGFLHELGHYATLKSFNEYELMICHFIKENSDDCVDYWEVADEFSANMWEIDFVNNCPQYVEELCDIYRKYWNDFIERRV